MFHETHYRTIVKSITWRLIAFISSVIVLYLMINDLKTAINHSLIIHYKHPAILLQDVGVFLLIQSMKQLTIIE